MEADGSSARRLPYSPGRDAHPAFTPDGARIVFQSPRDHATADEVDLYVMEADGGRQLAIYADPEGRDQLFLLDLDSGAAVPLACSAAVDGAPAFSPDGRLVAFTSTRDGGRDLHRVEVATGAVVRLTQGVEVWAQPSWSPDGRRILFSGKVGGVDDLYLVNEDGTSLARMTRGAEGIR